MHSECRLQSAPRSFISMILIKLFIVLLFGTILLMPMFQYMTAWLTFNLSEYYVKLGIGHATSLSGFETLPLIEFNQSDDTESVNQAICEKGKYLGALDVYQDCVSECSSADFEYKYIKKTDKVIINGRKLMGAYCIPTGVSKCNLNTSHAIVGLDGYQCITQFPSLLGGATGSEIVGCATGKLYDGLTKQTYVNRIPPNLNISDVDERTTDGNLRFTCVYENGAISLPNLIGSRFESEHNVCKLFDAAGEVNLITGACKCDNYMHNDDGSLCTRCTQGFGIDTLQHGSKYGYSIARDCVNPITESDIKSAVVIPCGKRTLELDRQCERALLISSNTYTPMTLENIFN